LGEREARRVRTGREEGSAFWKIGSIVGGGLSKKKGRRGHRRLEKQAIRGGISPGETERGEKAPAKNERNITEGKFKGRIFY